MPNKTSKKKVAAPELPSIPKELIEALVSDPMNAEAVNAASMAFKKALIERALGVELTHHLDSRTTTLRTVIPAAALLGIFAFIHQSHSRQHVDSTEILCCCFLV
jgi:hypothetical protein